MGTVTEGHPYGLKRRVLPMSWVQLVVKQNLVAHTPIHDERIRTRARHEVHAPGGRRNTSRDVHFPKSVINRLAAKQEKALKNQRGVRLRVHVRDVKEVLAAEDVELLERVHTTKDVHFRAFEQQASVFRLHLDAEITPR